MITWMNKENGSTKLQTFLRPNQTWAIILMYKIWLCNVLCAKLLKWCEKFKTLALENNVSCEFKNLKHVIMCLCGVDSQDSYWSIIDISIFL